MEDPGPADRIEKTKMTRWQLTLAMAGTAFCAFGITGATSVAVPVSMAYGVEPPITEAGLTKLDEAARESAGLEDGPAAKPDVTASQPGTSKVIRAV